MVDFSEIIEFSEEDIETLAHHGVKGMKWGVRRDRSGSSPGSSSSKKVKKPTSSGSSGKMKIASKPATSEVAIKGAQTTAKVATVATVKAVNMGAVPVAATAMGLAFPAAALLGLGVKVLQDPHVQEAIKAGATYAKDFAVQAGDVTLEAMRRG